MRRIAVAAVWLCAGSSPARAADPSWSVIPLEGDAAAARRVETWVVDGLGQLGRPAQLASFALQDMLIALGCVERSAFCLALLGDQLGAPSIVYGEARGEAEVQVKLFAFDVKAKKAIGQGEFTVRGDDASSVVGALREMLGLRAEGALEVRSRVPEVAITLDGEPRGATPLRIEGLAEGRYRVEASKPGYKPWSGEVTVAAGQPAKLDVALEAEPAGAMFSFASLERIRSRTWLTAGAAVAVAAVGVVFGVMASSAQQDVDGDPVASYADLQALDERADQGERYALIANVGVGLGAATLVAAGVLGYLDWRADAAAPGRRASLSSDGVRVSW